eukprot:8135650-Lingulodinium_polyedra.AAC.1
MCMYDSNAEAPGDRRRCPTAGARASGRGRQDACSNAGAPAQAADRSGRAGGVGVVRLVKAPGAGWPRGQKSPGATSEQSHAAGLASQLRP